MNELMVKDVNFNGALLKAAQDANNVIWVGVRWICDGIGLSEGQRNRQLNNIKTDLVVSKGISNLVFPTNGGNQEILCLMLDFLPLWLAKIRITPKMQQETPELVERLVEYQLKAKDVLVEAFLGKQKNEVIRQEGQTVQLQFPTFPVYDEEFLELNQKIDKLYSDMGKFVRLMMEWKQSCVNDGAIEQRPGQKPLQEISIVSGNSGCKVWKQKIYGLIDNALRVEGRFADVKSVMKYIYDYMRKNYGVVWEQEAREYMDRNNCTRKPSTIDVVYDNKTYRSIFESVLADLAGNSCIDSVHKSNIGKNTDEIIRPLIEKYHDNSNAGMRTYQVVYKYMDENNKISWKNRETRYINQYGAKTLTKKNMINANSTLMKMFGNAVKALLEE